MRVITPKVELGLGGSYFARVIADGAGNWHDWRMRPANQDQTVFNEGFDDPSSALPGYGDLILRGSPLPLLRQASPLPEGGVAVTFDGVQNWMDTGVAALTKPGLAPISFGVGLTIASLPGVGQEPALMQSSSDTFSLKLRNDGRVYGYYNGTAVVDGAISLNTPTLVVLTRAGTSPDAINLYINGTLADSATPARVSIVTGVIHFARNGPLGSNFLAATYFHAVIDPVALTQSQVTQQLSATQWTDVTSDYRISTSISAEQGIRDDSPLSRVAGTGVSSFALDNSEKNSAGLLGYYSPAHANCRSGFAQGIPCRISVVVASTTYQQFTGRVTSIAPVPGAKRERLTVVTAQDIMAQAERQLLDQVPVLENVRGDEVFKAIVDTMPNQPAGVVLNPGTDEYPLALDNTRDEAVYADEEFVRLANSELGYIYVGRTGALIYEARGTRVLEQSTPAVTIASRFVDADIAEVSHTRINRVQVTAHPRRVDASATTVLAAIESAIELGPGETRTFSLPYRAPGTDVRVGGKNMVAPVPTTDYQAFEFDDASGVDYTASLNVVAPAATPDDFGANSVEVTASNPLSVTIYITKFQVRGKGIYTFQPIVLRAKDDAGIAADGLNNADFDAPYQSDPNVAYGLATLILNSYAGVGTRARSIRLCANDEGLPSDLLARDISDRVEISETLTALAGEYYIQGRRFEFVAGKAAFVTWWLTPADPQTYWVLGQSGASELGTTTRLYAA